MWSCKRKGPCDAHLRTSFLVGFLTPFYSPTATGPCVAPQHAANNSQCLYNKGTPCAELRSGLPVVRSR